MEAARLAGIALKAPCGGNGRCGKCRVRILASGEQESITVLGCQKVVVEDSTVEAEPDWVPLMILQEGK